MNDERRRRQMQPEAAIAAARQSFRIGAVEAHGKGE